MNTDTVAPDVLAALASSVCDTLIVLTRHQDVCKQCRFDDRYCATAGTYQRNLLRDLKAYERAKGPQ